MAVLVNRIKRKSVHTILQLAYSYPLIVPAALAGFGVVGMILLVLGLLSTVLAVGLGGSLALILSALIYTHAKRPSGYSREHTVADILSMVFVSSWLVFNIFYTAQHLIMDRDPALYANAAHHLVSHNNLILPSRENLRTIEGTYETSQGVDYSNESDKEIHIQGSHLLPMFLGVSGRFVGEVHMLRLVVVFGAVALIAFYGFARFLVKPKWALLGMVTLAVSLPMIHFSRDAYNEPLTLSLIFGGLALAWVARQADNKYLWIISSIVMGSSILARPDSVIPVTSAILALWAIAAFSKPKERYGTLLNTIYFATPLLFCAVLAWMDLTLLANHYYSHIHSQIMAQAYLLVAVILAGATAYWAFGKWKDVPVKFLSLLRKFGIPLLVVLIVVIVLVLASRPLWLKVTGSEEYVRFSPVAEIQDRFGFPIEPARKYSEDTVNWVSWYLGGPLVLLALAGYILIIRRSIESKDSKPLLFLLVFTATSALYFVTPSIFPDQIWAIRRFLPVVIPGLIILSMVVLDYLDDKFIRGQPLRPIYSLLISGFVLLTPLQVSRPFLTTRSITHYDYIQNFCESVDDGNTIVVWIGIAAMSAVRTTDNYCGIQSVGIRGGETTKEMLGRAAADIHNQGKRPVLAVYGSDVKWFPWLDFINLATASQVNWQEPERTVYSAPKGLNYKEDSILVGELRLTGDISSIKYP